MSIINRILERVKQIKYLRKCLNQNIEQKKNMQQNKIIQPSHNIQIIDVKNFDNYIHTCTTKTKIVIHGTYGGTYEGALQTFKTGTRGVSTHFIISQDAKIYRLFPQQYFAYHAGANFRIISQTSFGIQIVNWLSLQKKDDNYFTWTSRQINLNRVKETEQWRGNKYWHTITPQQHKSLQFLLKYLCQKYDIKKKLYRNYQPDTYNKANFQGILFHSSFHPTRLDFQPSVIPRIII